jgi:hypothetical protein
VQRGLIGTLGLDASAAGSVLPHEDVVPSVVTGRRELMEALRANLEPIFLLYDGDGGAASGGAVVGGAASGEAVPGAATGLVDLVADTREPAVSAVTDDGVTHRLWAVTDPAEHAVVAADLRRRRALIADGHHRYAAYLELQARARAGGRGPGPWDYGLAFLVDSAAYPPVISAIHRVIPGLPPSRAAELASRAFTVRDLPADLGGALRALGEAGRAGPAYVLAGGDRYHLLTRPDPAQLAAAMPPGHSPRWHGLAPAILAELLVERVWGLVDNEPEVHVVHQDAAAALHAADAVGGTAVICNPVAAVDVRTIAENGERVPRKSTSFGPKPRTGLVIRTFD